MRTGRRTLAAAIVLTPLLVAACTSTSGSAASGDSVARATDAGAASGTAQGSTRARATVGGAGARLAPQLILNGSVSLVVGSVNTAATKAESMATAVGGRTDADDRQTAQGARPSADLTLRVPNAAIPTFLNRLAELGRQTGRHLSTQDVTADVADVTSRVSSARAAIASLRSLYQRATKVADVIRIESTLSQREAQLESLEARQRSLAGQVALATITVHLTQRRAPAAPVLRQSSRGGFVGGLDHGWHAFVTTISGLAVALGAVLPFAVLLLVLGAVAWVVRRRVREARPSSARTAE